LKKTALAVSELIVTHTQPYVCSLSLPKFVGREKNFERKLSKPLYYLLLSIFKLPKHLIYATSTSCSLAALFHKKTKNIF